MRVPWGGVTNPRPSLPHARTAFWASRGHGALGLVPWLDEMSCVQVWQFCVCCAQTGYSPFSVFGTGWLWPAEASGCPWPPAPSSSVTHEHGKGEADRPWRKWQALSLDDDCLQTCSAELNFNRVRFPTRSFSGVCQIKGNWATPSLRSVFLGQLRALQLCSPPEV